ncbi:MAG TPA: hypothetical protein VK797_07105 [Tepidisphaeraceae bacterium]|nr:hypothetical protein [Tepidisphaeraceae bacterium]
MSAGLQMNNLQNYLKMIRWTFRLFGFRAAFWVLTIGLWFGVGYVAKPLFPQSSTATTKPSDAVKPADAVKPSDAGTAKQENSASNENVRKFGLTYDSAIAVWAAVLLFEVLSALLEILSALYAWYRSLRNPKAIAWIGDSDPPAQWTKFLGFQVMKSPEPVNKSQRVQVASFRCIMVELQAGAPAPPWLDPLRDMCEPGRVFTWTTPTGPPKSSAQELILHVAAVAAMAASE